MAGILAINPIYADAYRTAGDHVARNYRFEEAVELTRRALQLDPANIQASADLGTHLLRVGDEPGARRALETAFKADPYDVVTFNQLAMLDTVDKFQTFRDGDLVVRLHPDEAGVMRDQVVPLARRALDTLSEKYQFKPTGPILVEMFPKHDDFAVRTIGLPGFVGALGACFGKVVTLDSPRAQTAGHLQLDRHALARDGARHQPADVQQPGAALGVRRHLAVRGAARTSRMGTRNGDSVCAGARGREGPQDSRHQRELQRPAVVVAPLPRVVARHRASRGHVRRAGLVAAAPGYGKGLETEEAFKAAFNATIDEIQVSFDARLNRDYASLRAALKTPEIPRGRHRRSAEGRGRQQPGQLRVQMRLAQALNEAGDVTEAIAALERAGRLVPAANGEANPNAAIAQLALKQGDTARAIRALEAVIKVESADVEAARKLASLVAPLGDEARTAAVYALVAELDPFDGQAQAVVGRRALAQT